MKFHFWLCADVPKKGSSPTRRGSKGFKKVIELCSSSSSRFPGKASRSFEVPNTFRESMYQSQARSGDAKWALDSVVDGKISPMMTYATQALDSVVDRRVSLGRSYATQAPDSIAHSPDPYVRDEVDPSRAPPPHHPRCPRCFNYSLLLDECEILKGYLQHGEHQVDRLRGELMVADRTVSAAHSNGIHDGFKQGLRYFHSKVKVTLPSINPSRYIRFNLSCNKLGP